MTITTLTCLRCNYKWIPRTDKRQVKCPNCQSRKWDEVKLTGNGAGDNREVIK